MSRAIGQVELHNICCVKPQQTLLEAHTHDMCISAHPPTPAARRRSAVTNGQEVHGTLWRCVRQQQCRQHQSSTLHCSHSSNLDEFIRFNSGCARKAQHSGSKHPVTAVCGCESLSVHMQQLLCCVRVNRCHFHAASPSSLTCVSLLILSKYVLVRSVRNLQCSWRCIKRRTSSRTRERVVRATLCIARLSLTLQHHQ